MLPSESYPLKRRHGKDTSPFSPKRAEDRSTSLQLGCSTWCSPIRPSSEHSHAELHHLAHKRSSKKLSSSSGSPYECPECLPDCLPVVECMS